MVIGYLYRQTIKGIKWIPWYQEAMKDVVGCDKPRGAVKLALIRGFPNGVNPVRVMPYHLYLNP